LSPQAPIEHTMRAERARMVCLSGYLSLPFDVQQSCL